MGYSRWGWPGQQCRLNQLSGQLAEFDLASLGDHPQHPQRLSRVAAPPCHHDAQRLVAHRSARVAWGDQLGTLITGG